MLVALLLLLLLNVGFTSRVEAQSTLKFLVLLFPWTRPFLTRVTAAGEEDLLLARLLCLCYFPSAHAVFRFSLLPSFIFPA